MGDLYRQAVPLPAHVDARAGACFGVPALTAMHAVLCHGGVQDKSVLVTGGAGAVGHDAIQFARLLGARQVISTVSSEAKAATARLAGASEVLNYRTDDVVERVNALTNGRGVDRVIEVDVAGNAKQAAALTAIGGEWVAYGSSRQDVALTFFQMISRNISVHFFVVYRLNAADRESAITQLHALLAKGVVRHNIAMEMALEDIATAHELVEQSKLIGNVVLRV